MQELIGRKIAKGWSYCSKIKCKGMIEIGIYRVWYDADVIILHIFTNLFITINNPIIIALV